VLPSGALARNISADFGSFEELPPIQRRPVPPSRVAAGLLVLDGGYPEITKTANADLPLVCPLSRRPLPHHGLS